MSSVPVNLLSSAQFYQSQAQSEPPISLRANSDADRILCEINSGLPMRPADEIRMVARATHFRLTSSESLPVRLVLVS